ncbi:PREDICTED: ABC transporter G family member 20-like [Amphimedon queenslandica]|uniref:ABC transmembrane type-2 domain-containing protein n=1 Tax=Amphimedon queenslandica TaxID=400682 RepID=A0A1X7TAT1_AMPQE|nr:PREDICTED: ABC transporter G family member 20-like [Amphimedon queenslandica]|eukprot:XP_003390840.2 PREDICTED: ABC transporter G family member 20-like [Amphimedon queenslandica]
MCECDPINPSTILPRPRSIAALCWKNFTRIYRNPGLLIFQFLLPAFQIVLFCLAIGGNFSGVSVAIMNSDRGINYSEATGMGEYIFDKCTPFENMDNFGSLFVSKLDDKSLDFTYYDSMTDAVDAVKKGKAWMAIVIPENFTQDMVERLGSIILQDNIPDDIINGSTIEIYEDVTDLQMTYTLQNKTTAASELFLEAFINNCNVSKKDISSPLQVHNPPVYGGFHLSYTDYVAPGMIVSITFGMSIGLTALSFVIERKEGLLDRTWVAGVNVTEMVLAQIFTQCIILFVQSTILIILVRFAFKVYMVHLRSIFLVELLTMLQGLTGMAYGLLISSLCQQETSAMQIMAGSVYPVLLMSGIIWPLEGMPKFLRYISYALPTTYAAEAMRSIMGRGWGLADMFVWRGFTITIAWFLLFGVLATIGLRLRK